VKSKQIVGRRDPSEERARVGIDVIPSRDRLSSGLRDMPVQLPTSTASRNRGLRSGRFVTEFS